MRILRDIPYYVHFEISPVQKSVLKDDVLLKYKSHLQLEGDIQNTELNVYHIYTILVGEN